VARKNPSTTPNDLTGKVALVTGAGIRLGRAIALGLAQNGCDLVLHCRSSRKEATALAKEIRELGRRAVVLQADLSRASIVKMLAKKAEAAFGRVDILINSAAIFWPTKLENLTVAELDAFLDVNLKAPYILSSEIGRRMKKRGSGAIVNLACLSGLKPWKAFVPYSISKAGVVSLTVGMAKLLGPEVRVNAIAPGTVLPPEGMSSKELNAIRRRLPLQRLGHPDDIVCAVQYLVGSSFVTGQVLPVDGGRSAV
jgi:NAD(P)-dependent dehydrogenase (short-subunit alcohol dehydrogenase family)